MTPNDTNCDEDLSNIAPLRPSSAERALNLASMLDEKAHDAVATAARKAEDAGAAVADALESGSRYLQEEGLKEMAQDVTNLIRRNPIPALLLGVAAGFLVGRVLTPRS